MSKTAVNNFNQMSDVVLSPCQDCTERFAYADYEWQLHNAILGSSGTTSVVPYTTDSVVEKSNLKLECSNLSDTTGQIRVCAKKM